MSASRFGNWALVAALLVLGLGFVGWVLQEPGSDAEQEPAQGDPETPDATGRALDSDTAPAMLGPAPAVLDPEVAKRHPQIAQLVRDTRLRARKREGSDKDLRQPLPGVKRMVANDLDAWRSYAPTLAAMLVKSGVRLDEDGQGGFRLKYDDHAMVSVLEAIGRLPRAAAKSLQERFLYPGSAATLSVEQRIAELILEALGPDEFIAWSIEVLQRSELRGLWQRILPNGKTVLMNPSGLGRAALLAVLKRLAAQSDALAARIRQLVLDAAASGRSGMRDVFRTVSPNDILLAMDATGPSKAGYLGAKRSAYLRGLDDSHPYVAYLALRALHVDGQTQRAVLRPAMLRLLASQFSNVRTGMIEFAPFIIEKLDYAVGTLNEMLSSSDAGVVTDAPKLLARLAPLRGDVDVGRLVGRILSRSDPVVRKRLIADLTQFRMTAREEVEMLREYVGDRDRTVRLAVVEALGYLGQRNPTADEPRLLLARAQRDKDPEVRTTAEAWIEELRMAAEVAEENKDQRKVSRREGG